MLRLVNRLLLPAGLALVPRPPSNKSLIEHANVGEAHHPARGGRTVRWMRDVAELLGGDEYRR